MYYSINVLRNVGIQATTTDFLFVVDVDFVLSRDATLTLNNYAQFVKNKNLQSHVSEQENTSVVKLRKSPPGELCVSFFFNFQALLVPSFEAASADYEIALSKRDFTLDLLSEKVQGYQFVFSPTISCTDYWYFSV